MSSAACLLYTLRMQKPARRQLNVRLGDEHLDKVDALRRKRSPIPNTSELVRDLIDAAYAAEDAALAKDLKRK